MTEPGLEAGPNARLLAGAQVAANTGIRRVGNALGVSALAHTTALLLVLLALTRLPLPEHNATLSIEPPHITWIAQPGDGGGASGDKNPAPPRQLQSPGHDAVTVPVKDRSEPAKIDRPTPQQPIDVPALSTASGVQELPGVVTGLTAITIADSQGPGTGGRAGAGNGLGNGSGNGHGLGPGQNGGTGGEGVPGGNGVTPPRLIREVKPGYTADAMRARVQGTVRVQAIVLPDGSVGSAQVVRSLDDTFGLDEEAVKTVKLWRFVPGTRAGRPVSTLVDVELTFTLR